MKRFTKKATIRHKKSRVGYGDMVFDKVEGVWAYAKFEQQPIPGGMTKDERRNALWANLSPQEQLAQLDAKGLRAEKQRAKIAALLMK